ncbi:hypothetical protein BX666DRAFT_1647254 [Dichotomocladium elegans]|nr:hypothetical protein BX666DRAFT_1647254 [Dichotomocladium elegans]
MSADISHPTIHVESSRTSVEGSIESSGTCNAGNNVPRKQELLPPLDGSRGWLVVFGSFLTWFAIFGFVISWGKKKKKLSCIPLRTLHRLIDDKSKTKQKKRRDAGSS